MTPERIKELAHGCTTDFRARIAIENAIRVALAEDALARALAAQDEREEISVWLVAHWNSTIQGKPLHQWVGEHMLRCGGVLAAAAEARRMAHVSMKVIPR